VDGDLTVLRNRVPADELRRFYMDRHVLDRSIEGDLITSENDAPSRDLENCDAGFTRVSIEADGSVVPCLGLARRFGSVLEAPFKSVWRSKEAEEYRRLAKRPLSACNQCEMAPLCSTRCPRLALLEDGDMSGPSQRACDLTAIIAELRGVRLQSAAHLESSPERGRHSGGEGGDIRYEEGLREAGSLQPGCL
jgi:radical SAM protein with 4Fe4S-binding SPASM domain